MPENNRLRRRDPLGELVALLATALLLGLILLGARWLVEHRPPAAAAAAAPAPVSDPNDPILLEVNGEPVRRSEFAAAISSLPPQMQQQLKTDEARKQLAEEFVKMKLLEQYARKNGLDRDPEIRGQLQMMRGNVLASAALRSILQKSKPPTIEELYEKTKKQFEVAQVKSIVIPYQGSRAQPRSGKPLTLPQAQVKAQEVVRRLRGGEDFGAVARAESADNVGGELGEVSRGTMPPELDEVIFTIPLNQISDPLQSAFGIHILKVTDRKVRSLEELRPLLQQEARTFHANAVLEDLRKNAKVEYKKEFFKG